MSIPIAFTLGVAAFYVFQRFGAKWLRGSDENTKRFLRSLNHDQFMRFYRLTVDESWRRYPKTEPIFQPDNGAEQPPAAERTHV